MYLLSIEKKNIARASCIMYPKNRPITKDFSGLYAGRSSQGLVQEGVNLGRAQGTHYQKSKTPRIWPTIFGVNPAIYFFAKKNILFQDSRQEGGGTFHPPGLAASLQLGVSIPGKFTTE